MNNLEKEAQKVHKVICSCLNKDQLRVANNMVNLFFKKWGREKVFMYNSTRQDYIYWCGQLIGLIQGRLLEFDKEYKPNYKELL